MPGYFLETPIEYLKGVGPARSLMLNKELQVFSFGDLLSFFPYRYVDRSKFSKISEIRDDGSYVQIRAKIIRIAATGTAYSKRIIATASDATGELDLVWFQGARWITEKLKPGIDYIIFGKPTWFNGRLNIAHPEMELPVDFAIPLSESIRPMYNSTEKLKSKGLDSRGISKLVKTLLLSEKFQINENLTRDLLSELKLISRQEAFINIHFPASHELLQKAQARLRFEELFFIQLRLLKQKYIRLNKPNGIIFATIGTHVNDFYHHHLHFELTNAQKRVIKEIRHDLGSGKQMNRLLQGDVGSGKTMVALMTMLIALDNNYQAVLMAPTEILANQHFRNISGMLSELNVGVNLLTGATKPAERKKISEGLLNGSIKILIGTHALLEEHVRFKNLGMVVIDEQHRFGVAQRARLWDKNVITPHILVMTATPIPRTLAMTLYGDLDISVIDEMPPGRKPIITRHVFESKRREVYQFLHKKIGEGSQVYVVYPLIKESETLDLKNLMDGFESLKTEFPSPGYTISMVHGQMKQKEKDHEMNRFLHNETHLMVATTVIEVGVDIPNASVMVIENAERFGLSQLHQLRGRVGRGADQAYCILMSGEKVSSDARKRIQTMVRTNDGFEIAETDLQLRGPGDLEGTQQSGILDLRIADIIRDEKLLKFARNKAMDIIREDPELMQTKNSVLNGHLAAMYKSMENWGLIS